MTSISHLLLFSANVNNRGNSSEWATNTHCGALYSTPFVMIIFLLLSKLSQIAYLDSCSIISVNVSKSILFCK